ncbi:MAG: alpha/beta fold hydrolase, partial [Chloroflexi bacterium]|nr:alpha/beta fold hydrolase [Chloroflexota bacterium]
MRRRLIRLTLVVLLGLSIGGTLGVFYISRQEALEFVHPEREVLSSTPADNGLDYEEVVLITEDGLALRAWYLPGTNGAAIIVQHGYGGSRQRMLLEASMLHKHGYGVLLFDWRGHGESEGGLVTFGYYEIRDAQAALAWLQNRPEVDSDRMGVLGDSMGAVALLYAAARMPEIKAVVAISPFPSLMAEVE